MHQIPKEQVGATLSSPIEKFRFIFKIFVSIIKTKKKSVRGPPVEEEVLEMSFTGCRAIAVYLFYLLK